MENKNVVTVGQFLSLYAGYTDFDKVLTYKCEDDGQVQDYRGLVTHDMVVKKFTTSADWDGNVHMTVFVEVM